MSVTSQIKNSRVIRMSSDEMSASPARDTFATLGGTF